MFLIKTMIMFLRNILIFIDLLFITGVLVFTWESFREGEPRAPWVGLSFILALLSAGVLIFLWPKTAGLLTAAFSMLFLLFIVLLIPGGRNPQSLAGSRGYAKGEVERFDERDIVFARNRSLPENSDVYHRYYKRNPGREARDAARRKKGGPVGSLGVIDAGYRPNVSMIEASFMIPDLFGPVALPRTNEEKAVISPSKAAKIVKGFAGHLGASLVGICKVDPLWVYSHRGEIFDGNWDRWGEAIPDPLPYAVVIATEMDYRNVCTAPHTPTLLESAGNYAMGAHITTVLAHWFSHMGYQAAAHHSRHYDLPLVPLAVDAGLGELGRFGYLIAKTYGARVRLFAVTTDMPMHVDKPVDLGVNDFCERCKKCAEACPSRSIPHGGKVVFKGIEKWKLDEESCFDYWGKAGTDCSVCMAICPYSRPDRSIHRLARWILKRSPIARKTFPYLDNFIYGKKWRSRRPSAWIDPQLMD